MERRRVILIGLDGCDYSILDSLIAQGKLPFFKQVMNEGVRADLESTYPMNTLPAWTSIFIGVNPGKHGVADFITRKEADFRITGSGQRETPTIWHLLSGYGKKVIIVNDPISWPPEEVNGITTTGFLTPPGNEKMVYPSALKDELPSLFEGYIPELGEQLEDLVRKDRNAAYSLINEFGNRHFEIAMTLAARFEWDVMAIIITSTDRLQHFFFGDTEMVSSHYQMLDRRLTALVDRIPDSNLLLVSDHGFGPLRKMFFTNTWLQRQGFAVEYDSILHKTLRRLGLTRRTLRSLMMRTRTFSLAMRVIPDGVKQQVPHSPGLSRINYSRSGVVQTTSNGGLYFSNNALAEVVADRLQSITFGGASVVERIQSRNAAIWGPYSSRAADLFPIPREGFELSPRLAKSLVASPQDVGEIRTGTHRQNGIFLAVGPDIAKGIKLRSLKCWDVAPTLLHLAGLPIPEYMDGRIVSEAFSHESKLKVTQTPAEVTGGIIRGHDGTGEMTDDDEAALKERLKSLGYI